MVRDRGKPWVAAAAFLMTACGGRYLEKPDEGGASGPAALVGDLSGRDPNFVAGACEGSLVHVAFGADSGNTDFDYASGCSADERSAGAPVGYFVGDQLVLSACQAPGRSKPGIRMTIAGVMEPGPYHTNHVEFIAPDSRAWSYGGSRPSYDLGWTTTIEELGTVGGAIKGNYTGSIPEGPEPLHLMGFFSVCRAPDQPAR